MQPHKSELLLVDKQNHKAPHRHHIVCIAWHTFNQIASSFGERLNCVLLQCVLIKSDLCQSFAKMLSSTNTSLLEYHNTRMRQPPYRSQDMPHARLLYERRLGASEYRKKYLFESNKIYLSICGDASSSSENRTMKLNISIKFGLAYHQQ